MDRVRGTMVRGMIAAGAMAIGWAASPASAQFFMQSRDYSGTPVRGDEPGMGSPLPGATPAEVTAGLVWNMRAALNVAALQCQFEPTLLTRENYNAILLDHKDELAATWITLTKYFVRTNKTAKDGQNALDQFGTRTYSGFATVSSQYGFCRTANAIGRDALFQPRGSLAAFSQNRMRELRNSLTPYGEQRFPRYIGWDTVAVPRLDPICWSKKAEWQIKKCGVMAWPPVSAAQVGVAPVGATVAANPQTVTAAR